MLAAFGVGIVASCKEPTSILVEARTNVAYQAGAVTTFTVGAPGETEGPGVTTETQKAWGPDGFIGSLAVVPATGDGATLSVRVVLGVRRATRECAPPAYDGCIVARRRIRYVPNERLVLPIDLRLRCLGVACSADTTCDAFGACVPAQLDATACNDEGCRLPSERTLPPGVDPPDAAGDVVVVEAAVDGASDAGKDVTLDAPRDAKDRDTGLSRPPGDKDCKTVTCSEDQTCCFNTSTQTGNCAAVDELCPMPVTFPVRCDGAEDCPAGYRCCGNSGGFNCNTSCMGGIEICHGDGTCLDGKTCTQSTGYYRLCE